MPKTDRPYALDVAGDGPQRAEMETLATTLGIRDRITFHGWVNETQIDELAAQARAIIFPAVWHEPAGLVTLDAGSRGRAVIASRTGGIPEFAIDGQNALVVNPNDDVGLIVAIEKLIDDWGLAQRLGEAGHALTEGDFSLSNHISNLDGVYRSLVGSPRDLVDAGPGRHHES